MTGHVLAGRYELIDEINQHDTCKFYRARDLSLTRVVTVRKWSAGIDPTTVEAFANIREPGVIHVFDALKSDGHMYLVTEDVRGKTLDRLCRQKADFNLVTAANLTLSIAEVVLSIQKHGWAVAALNLSDIFVDENAVPTISYAKLRQSDRDIDSIEAIGQVLLEMLSSIDTDEIRDAQFLFARSLRDIAERATDSRTWGPSYQSFTEFINDLSQLCQHAPGQLPQDLLSAVDADEVRLEDTLVYLPKKQGKNPVIWKEKFKSILKWRRLPLAGGAVAAIVVLVIGGSWLSHFRSAQISLPDLRGQTMAVADMKLRNLGWHGNFSVDKQVNYDVPEGSILQESPGPGAKIGKADSITVTVASPTGANSNAIAKFVGQDASTVFSQLLQQGVPVENITLKPQHSTGPSGSVLSQIPSAGGNFDPKSTPVELDVAVSSGETLVPNVLNMNVDNAGNLLVQNGLHYQFYIDRTGGSTGTVVEQVAAPGKVIPTGSMVELHVSK